MLIRNDRKMFVGVQNHPRTFEIIVPECPIDGGKWKHYDGCCGYESLQCEKCGLDINDIKVIKGD